MPLEHSYDLYVQRILSDFRYLEAFGTGEPGCFVLVNADISLDGEPDVRAAVDLSGNIISLLFISETWSSLRLTAPLMLSPEPPAEDNDSAEPADELDANNQKDEGLGDDSFGGEADDDGDADDGNGGAAVLPSTPPPSPNTQVDFRPLLEDENLWLFAYVISREALMVGQESVFTVFRRLDLGYEERFGYPFVNLIAPPAQFEEILPQVDMLSVTTHELTTVNHVLKIYDFSDGTRLILYINSSTQYCDGFNISTVPI